MLEDRRITIRQQLLGAFLLVVVIVAVTGYVGYSSVSKVGASADRIVEEDVAVADAAMEMKFAVEKEQSALRGVVLGEEGTEASFREAAEHFRTWEQKLEDNDLTAEQRRTVESLKATHQERVALAEEAMVAMEDGDEALATERLHTVEEQTAELESTVTDFETAADEHMAASLQRDQQVQQIAELEIVGLTVLAFLLSGALGFVLSRRISDPLAELSEAAAAISRGQFGDQASVSELDRDDEIADMTDAFAEMRDNLDRQIAALHDVSENLERGHLDADVRTDLPGEFGHIMSNVDDGMSQLDRSFEQIEDASAALRSGDLDQSFDTDLPGDYGDVMAELDAGMDNFERSFREIAEASAALERGDLTADVRTDLPGIYGDVMANLDESIDALSASMVDVRRVAEEVSEGTTEVSAGAEQIETTSEEVATTIEQISAGAEQQHDSLDQVSGEMSNLSATIEEIASSADEVAATSDRAVERGNEGQTAAERGLDAMDDIERKAAETAQDMRSLEAEIGQINEVVDLIDQIAEQVNMLALNASIEAARAGEAGEGFGVVASEIKSLAEETASATDEVESLVDSVQASTNSTAAEMTEMRERVENGRATVEEGLGALEDIVASIEDANGGVQSINDATDEQAASSQEVVAMVDDVTAVSQQTSAEAQNVSAAAEEQTAAITQIANNAQSIAARSDDLERVVASFDLADGGASQANSPDRPAPSQSVSERVDDAEDRRPRPVVELDETSRPPVETTNGDESDGPTRLKPEDF